MHDKVGKGLHTMSITQYINVVINPFSVALSGRILSVFYPGLKAWAILLALFKAKEPFQGERRLLCGC
jgi:hypothetical protein